MAAHMMRPGDRTFFIYDHLVTKKEDDDPKDAIIYYFPQHTPIDIQCIFCNQLMGMVNCTKAIAGAPPKLYKLRKNKVATIHEGNFTLALACKMRNPDSAVIRKLENLYRVFAFYHCSIKRVKEISSNNEAFLSNMAAIWDFYVPYVRRYGNTVPATFEPIQSVKLLKGGNFQFLRCSHLLQWLKGQPSLLAGCILYKRSMLCTQLTPELTSHLLLNKPNQLHHPSKSVTDTVLPFGVRIMSVYVTEQQYKQLSTPLQSLTKPRRSPQAKQPDSFFYTPPASPTEKQSSEAQLLTSTQFTPKRTLERTIGSTAGRLFSNFTGMLEGTVVESLWPSASKSSSVRGDAQRESLKDGSPGSIKDGEESGLVLSRSSDDVVCALQGDGSSPGRSLTGTARRDDQTPTPSRYTDDGSNCSPRPMYCPDTFTNSPNSHDNETTVSGLPPVIYAASNGTVCTDERGENLTVENRTDRHGKDIASEQIGNCDDIKEIHPHAAADVRDASLGSSQRRDRGVDIVSENNDPLGHPSKFLKELPDLSEQKSESPESGIGDCAVHRRGEDFSGINRTVGEKDNGFEDAVENGPVRIYNAAEVISVDGRPLSSGSYHDSTLCKDGESEDNTVLHTEGNVKSTVNANVKHCLNDADTDAVLVNSSVVISANGDFSLLISRDDSNTDAVQVNPKQNSCDNSKQVDACGENSSFSSTKNSVHDAGTVKASSTSNKIQHSVLEASESKPNESSQLNMSAAEDAGKGDSLEDINSNIQYEDSENLSTVSSPACQIEDVDGEVTGDDEIGEIRLSKTKDSEEERNAEKKESTILVNNARNIASEQNTKGTECRPHKEGPSNSGTTKSANRTLCYLDKEVVEPQTVDVAKREYSPGHLTSVEESDSFTDAQSLEDEPANKEECGTFNAEKGSQEGDFIRADEQIPGVKVSDVKEPKMLSNTASLSPVVGRREGGVTLQEGVDDTRGDTPEELDSLRQEMGETSEGDRAARRPSLETHFSTQDHDKEPVPDLINVSLYVQAHSDTTLLFLAEKSITKEKDTLFQLWQSVLRELGELELQLKNVVRPERELDCKAAYNFIHFDNHQLSLEGTITNPVNQVESLFCRACQLTHEQFLSDETLTDITLRNQQTVIYAHQNACHHTFYHKSYKSSPSPGIPSRDDTGFYNQSSCKEALKEHNISLL